MDCCLDINTSHLGCDSTWSPMLWRNVCNHLQNHTVSQSRRPQSSNLHSPHNFKSLILRYYKTVKLGIVSFRIHSLISVTLLSQKCFRNVCFTIAVNLYFTVRARNTFASIMPDAIRKKAHRMVIRHVRTAT
jgi:hypothetical protein